MNRTRSPKSSRSAAVVALLVATLATATPALAAGPIGSFTDGLTAWAWSWLERFVPAVDGSQPERGGLDHHADRSTDSTEPGDGAPVDTTGGSSGPCELNCGEAGPGGDPNG